MSERASDRADDGLALRLVEVDGDRSLAAIDREVIAGLAGRLAAGILEKRRTPGAGVIADNRTLDLDDIGAEVGENLSGPRAGHDAAEVEDANMR